MNEEQAVLDFFAKEENLPLALIAAEHLDRIRLDLNNQFWRALEERLAAMLQTNGLPWTVRPTEDRNTENCLVGLHLEPISTTRLFLRPFMEQQLMGNDYRIYHGLMWSGSAAGQNPPALAQLASRLQQAGFRQADDFFAWQWLPWHPRRRDFLLEFSTRREALLDAALQPWNFLLQDCGDLLTQANLALAIPVGPSASFSLDQLRNTLPSRQ